MSAKGQRAQRRAELERRRAAARAGHERRAARASARRRRLGALRPRPTRVGRPGGVLARRRRLRAGAVVLVELVALAAVVALTDDAGLRVAAVVVALVALPVLLTAVSDRRI
ncbi:hypothetical protein CLV35_0077 [Motilibacter peucedani]|uniref:Uncharacterized protein n=1 Tax=Motilibacter peucedani TaxID=598650 RepID=A0A420XVL6_9ACTN|nr:hypothetical protein [Motilibacter peucedani]RKS84260.1 hypothetical protein CLV35_0077 [Motilibacter peucedani]